MPKQVSIRGKTITLTQLIVAEVLSVFALLTPGLIRIRQGLDIFWLRHNVRSPGKTGSDFKGFCIKNASMLTNFSSKGDKLKQGLPVNMRNDYGMFER